MNASTVTFLNPTCTTLEVAIATGQREGVGGWRRTEIHWKKERKTPDSFSGNSLI